MVVVVWSHEQPILRWLITFLLESELLLLLLIVKPLPGIVEVLGERSEVLLLFILNVAFPLEGVENLES